MVYKLQKSPHIAKKRSTFSIMLELTAVLAVLFIYAVIWNFVAREAEYGIHAIVIGVLSILTCVFADALWALPKLWAKDKEGKLLPVKERLVNWGDKILHSYGYVTGLILALLLPVGASSKIYYVTVISAFFGTFFAKSIFGGFGNNVFNPAIVGRIFAQLAFSSELKTVIGETSFTGVDIASGASITSSLQNGGWTSWFNNASPNISLGDLFLGNYSGTLGETFAFLIIIAGIYLVVRKIIDWRIPVFYLVTIFVASLIMGFASLQGVYSFEFALRQLFIGGALFGAVFCLTDPVTSPTQRAGKIIYAMFAALITLLIRYKASAPEGVAYSILLANIITPLIDKILVGRSNNKLALKASIVSVLGVGSVVFGACYGAFNKTENDYMSINAHLLDNALLEVDGYSETKVELQDEAASTLKEKYRIISEGRWYYSYVVETEDGYSGSVEFATLVSPYDLEAVSYYYIGGDEDSLGLEAAQTICITKNMPFAIGDTLVNGGFASATAYSTYPRIESALKDAINETKMSLGISIELTLEEKINQLTNSINLGAASDIAEVTTEAALIDLKATFTAGGASYYYYEAHSDAEAGWSGSVEFGLIINSENEIIGYSYLGGDEDGVGLGAAQTIEITPDHPFTSESTIDSSYASASAKKTFPAMEAAFKACIADASSAQ